MNSQGQTKLVNKAPQKKATWRPGDLLTHPGFEKDPRYVYRAINPNDVKRVFINGIDERGWEVVRHGAGGQEVDASEYTGAVTQFSSKALGSIQRRGSLILARMPVETAEVRNEHWLNEARKRVAKANNPKSNLTKNQNSFYNEEELARNFAIPKR